MLNNGLSKLWLIFPSKMFLFTKWMQGQPQFFQILFSLQHCWQHLLQIHSEKAQFQQKQQNFILFPRKTHIHGMICATILCNFKNISSATETCGVFWFVLTWRAFFCIIYFFLNIYTFWMVNYFFNIIHWACNISF